MSDSTSTCTDNDTCTSSSTKLVPHDKVCAHEIWNVLYGHPGRMPLREGRKIDGLLARVDGWRQLKGPMDLGDVVYKTQRWWVRIGSEDDKRAQERGL